MNLSNLTNKELQDLKRKTEYEISKYGNYEKAKKVQLNSAYGAFGNQYFRFFDVRLAEAVTLSGQLVIQWIEKYINDYLNKILKTDNIDYVIAIDTDSLYISLEDLVEKVLPETNKNVDKVITFLDNLCEKKLIPIIHEFCVELKEYTNGYDQKMRMKREALSDKALWTTKKRYAMNVYDLEGIRHKEPELKIMGLESVKSSTPEIVKDKIEETISVILRSNNDEVINFIEDFKKEFFQLNIEEIAKPTTMNGLEKYSDSKFLYRKSTPYHVKGSLIFNSLLKKHNVEKKYEVIRDGDKVKFVYLMEPNIVGEEGISFLTILPEEFNLTKYIDYQKQFDIVYMKPIKLILNAIGWQSEHISSLDFLFG